MDLARIKKVYLIGLGGIGLSAIARMMIGEGKMVSGSDQTTSLITAELEKLGVQVFYGHRAENITSDVDLVVYTIAIPEDNPELKKARELGIKCLTYPEMLGVISSDKYTIAVSGTHGKTTTTAMIAEMMISAHLAPTVIVGSLLSKKGSSSGRTNFIAGQSKYLLVEACEYRRSFLQLNPQIIVITNIDNDHLDYYKDLDDIQEAFIAFASKLPHGGFLVCDTNDPLLLPVVEAARKNGAQVIDYHPLKEEKSDRVGENTKLDLLVPGIHNIKNAQAALAIGQILGIDPIVSLEALNNFNGTWRRFEFKGQTQKGALVYDDYAHHPTEIKATIQAARDLMLKKKMMGKLLVVFQPHLYSRTKLLKNEFATSLALADQIFLLPIYAAREVADPTIDSSILADLIKPKNTAINTLNSFEQVSDYLLKEANQGDIILLLGAGDIFTLGDKLVESGV